MEKKNPREEEKIGTEEAFRSLGRFFSWMEGRIVSHGEFREYMKKGRLECLKGIKSLIDKRIADLEKDRPKTRDKKATRVKVD
jgi:hypothetical protein